MRRATKNVKCANIFFTFYTSCIRMLYSQAYVCALLKIAARYQHSQKIWHPWSSYKILIKCIFCNFTLWMIHCLGCPDPSPRTILVTTLCKFYGCSKSLRNIALCMHCYNGFSRPILNLENRIQLRLYIHVSSIIDVTRTTFTKAMFAWSPYDF